MATWQMDPSALSAHSRFAFALRHDLPTVDGTTIEKWTEVVNVGQPSGVLVRRGQGIVEVVVTKGRNWTDHRGVVHTVDAEDLLIALGEVEGKCQCSQGDLRCPAQR